MYVGRVFCIDDFKFDGPEVGCLTFAERGLLFECLRLAGGNGGIVPTVDEIAYRLHREDDLEINGEDEGRDKLELLIESLVELEFLIALEPGGFTVSEKGQLRREAA